MSRACSQKERFKSHRACADTFCTADTGLRGFAPRFPLAEVVTECEEPLNAPKNSLDLQRYLERKKI